MHGDDDFYGLSNTATPKYYGAFREEVLKGHIPVCETISLEMNRIDDLIKNPGVYYDPKAVEAWIRFCENELTLVDGSPLTLLDTFKIWGEQLYGWYYYIDTSVYVPNKDFHGGKYVKKRIKKRLVNKQYLIVARGGAKTLYDECHQAYGLIMDPSTTHGITTAPTMRQADEVISPFKTAIARSRGPLFKFLTYGSQHNTTGSEANRMKLAPTKKGIENRITNSLLEVRPMTIDKLQGLNNKYSTVDEWLSGDTREDVIGALEQGATKGDIDGWWIIATSSEGTVRNGVGDSIKMELMSILKGDYYNPHVSIWWYKLDDVKEVNNPSLWIKANPNLGKTVSYEAYQLDVKRAENVPSARNDILAKRFGIPMEGYTYFFTYDEIKKHTKQREFWKMECSLGCDMSLGDDFCAFTFLFPLNDHRDPSFGVKTRCYITERTMVGLPMAMRLKYEDFLKEGSLMVMDGTILDMMSVYDDLEKLIDEREYDVLTVGYDPYNAKSFIDRWVSEHGEFGVQKVIQGSKTESVPLGELKKLAQDRLLFFDQDLMEFAMGNCITLEDTNGNRKLLKRRRDQKIDSVSAMMDAYVAYKDNVDIFD